MDNRLLRYNTEIKIIQSSIKKLNPQFSLCDILVCYHGDNRNYTSVQKKIIESNLYSIYGIPIIGEWIYKLDGTDEKTWGSHGGRIIIDDEGIHFEQTTKPFGFVSKEAADNASWVTITEKDGHTQHEYLKLSGCILWTDRYEEAKTVLDKNYGQSMEIEIHKGHYREDHYYEIEEFIFSALCILGTDCEPCFESACIGRHYELDSFKQEFSLMLDEYKKFQNKNDSKTKGVNKMDFTKFTDELSKEKCRNNDKICKYRLLNVDDTKVYVLDVEDYKPYSFNYAMPKDEETNVEYLVIDYESKVEMSLSATDKIKQDGFNEFSIKDEIKSAIEKFSVEQEAETGKKISEVTKELSLNFKNEFDKLKEAYDTISNANTILQSKLDSYEKKEKEIKEEQHRQEIDDLVNSYNAKLGKYSTYLIYKSNIETHYSKTREQVEQDLILMAGKYLTSKENSFNKNFSYTPNEAGVIYKKPNDAITERYGNLLDKYL